ALIPAYNEMEGISVVVSAARAFLPVLVVDDGSRDTTAELAESAGAEVLRQRPNQGKGAALRAGFRWALERDCQAVITLDADGQHDPLEIPKFLDCFATTGADLVIGARDYRAMPPVRRFSNTIGRWTMEWALRSRVPDNQSGYRLISRRLMEELISSREQGFEFEVEMIAACLARGYGLEWVPIRTIYAGEGSHIQPLRHVVHFFRIAWAARRMVDRMK
ncbi:MAG TPA: glycosyltransferase family 2 protein, partial [Anaerolineaceae bacterium]